MESVCHKEPASSKKWPVGSFRSKEQLLSGTSAVLYSATPSSCRLRVKLKSASQSVRQAASERNPSPEVNIVLGSAVMAVMGDDDIWSRKIREKEEFSFDWPGGREINYHSGIFNTTRPRTAPARTTWNTTWRLWLPEHWLNTSS